MAGELVQDTQSKFAARHVERTWPPSAGFVLRNTTRPRHVESHGSDPSPTQDMKTGDEQPAALAEIHCDLRARAGVQWQRLGEMTALLRIPSNLGHQQRRRLKHRRLFGTRRYARVTAGNPSRCTNRRAAVSPERPGANADTAVEMLMDDLLDDVVGEMNRLEQTHGVAVQHERSTAVFLLCCVEYIRAKKCPN